MSQLDLLYQNQNYEYLDDGHIDNEYSFKYMPPTEFTRIAKQVYREKRKRKDDLVWEKFCMRTNSSSGRVTPIIGGYVVKSSETVSEERYGYIDDGSLLKSGAVTIFSTARTDEQVLAASDARHGDATKTVHKRPATERFEQKVVDTKDIDEVTDELRDVDLNEYCAVKEKVNIRKINAVQQKIESVVDKISDFWDKIPKPDGGEDLSRRQQRATEFASRFSRNYLYYAGTQYNDIKKIIKSTSSKPGNHYVLNPIFWQKLVRVHHIIVDALQAYYKHMPSSVPGGIPDKLDELLKHASSINQMCDDDVMSPLLFDDTGKTNLRAKYKLLQDRIESSTSRSGAVESATGPQQPVDKKNVEKTNGVPANRLSMYCSSYGFKTLAQVSVLKKNMNVLVKRKFGLQPGKRCARKPKADRETDKMELCIEENESKQSVKRAEHVKCRPKEDDIVTQMEIVSQRESKCTKNGDAANVTPSSSSASKVMEPPVIDVHVRSPASKGARKRETPEIPEKIQPLLEYLLESIKKNKADSGDEQKAKTSVDELEAILNKINRGRADTGAPAKDKKRRTSRNAKVYYVSHDGPDENSGDSVDGNAHTEPTVSKQDEDIVGPGTIDDILSGTPQETPRGRTGAPRPGPRRAGVDFKVPLVVVSRALKFKEEYARHVRGNNMYAVKKNRRPWETVSRLSDIILDDLLGKITKEFEIDQFLERMYDVEFK